MADPTEPTPITTVLNDENFRAYAAQDPAAAAAFISERLKSGQYRDDRMPSTGRGTQTSAANPGAPTAFSKLGAQLRGAPMGISNSIARTGAGAAKALGADISPEFMQGLEPRPGEGLGNVLGDAGQIYAGGAGLAAAFPKLAAFLSLADKGSGVGRALLRAGAQGGKAALGSGALTAAQSGGDMDAAKRDALIAGLTGGTMSLVGSAGKGAGKWLASTPFTTNTPERVAALQETLLPKMLAGFKPPELANVAADTAAERAAAGAAYGAAKKAVPPVSRSTYVSALAEPRPKFTYPQSIVKPQDPRNPNFFRFPVQTDVAVMPSFQPHVARMDEEARQMMQVVGKQPLSIENISKQRQQWDKVAQDTFNSGLPDASAREAVARAYSDSLRNLEHQHAGGALVPYLNAAAKSITADDMAQHALRGSASIGGDALRGANFRKALAAVTAMTAGLDPKAVLSGASLAYPAKMGWYTNRGGQLASALSSAPAVRAIQDATPNKKK